MTEYTAEVILPSKGILYKELVPEGKVTIRAMSTADEKRMYGSSNESAVFQTLSGCIISPEGLNIMDLVSADQFFLLLEIRKLTFGSSYHAKFTCPDCKRAFEAEFNIDDMMEDMVYADEDIEYPFPAELPKCGKTVTLRLLTGKDAEAIENMAKRQAAKTRAKKGELEYIIRLAKLIVTIDGEPVDMMAAREFVNNLHSMDSATIMSTLDKNAWGVPGTVFLDCPECGEDKEVLLPVGKEFFRPSL